MASSCHKGPIPVTESPDALMRSLQFTSKQADPVATFGFSQRRKLFLLLMALPATLYVAAIGVYPLLRGLVFSLFQYKLLQPHRTPFLGLQIYRDLIGDAAMRQALANTAIFTIATVAIQ